MLDRLRSAMLPGLALLLGACAVVRGTTGGAGEVPIAAARRLPPSTPVAVSGVVTVPSGALGDGFAVQDRSGGVYVLAGAGDRYPLGERVRVKGALEEVHGQLGIRPVSVEVLGSGEVPEARELRTGGVGEATEGLLVRVRGRVTGPVVDDRPYGWKVMLDDGSGPLLVFVSVASGIDVGAVREGQSLEVVGFSGQYDDHHEILPRTQADVRVLPGTSQRAPLRSTPAPG